MPDRPVLRVQGGSVFALQALHDAVTVTHGQHFEHSLNLDVLDPDGVLEVVNVADEVTSPSQVVLDERSSALLTQHSPVFGTPVSVDATTAGAVRLDIPRTRPFDAPAPAALVAPLTEDSWFTTPDGQRFGLPALDAAIAGRPDALLGMGPGLTPSGDDALVALIAWHWASDQPMASFEELVHRASSSTTSTSVTQLRCAVRGQASRPLIDLFEAVTATDPAAVLAAAGSVRAVGQTSGADALVALHRLWSTPAVPTQSTAPTGGNP